MNKLFFICSFFLVANGTMLSQNAKAYENLDENFRTSIKEVALPHAIDEIVFIEDMGELIDLGFDTSTYLPEGFDPYASEYEGAEYMEEPYEIDIKASMAKYYATTGVKKEKESSKPTL